MSKTHSYYLPTFLQNRGDDTRCTLLLRRFQKYRTRSGKYATKVMVDAVEYPDGAAMTEAIRSENMRELPKEAETNILYVPPELRSSSVRKVQKL